MAGKKKKKVAAKKKVGKRVSNFKGRTPGAKNKPKPKVYRVIGDHGYVLGDFATVDAARDAIEAQATLHSELRTSAPAQVSNESITMEGEDPAPIMIIAKSSASYMEYDWTIIVRRQEPSDFIHPEW